MVTFVTLTDLLGAVVYPEDEQQRDEIENSKKVLAKADVLSMVGDVVESCEDVDKASRVPATTQSQLNPTLKTTSNDRMERPTSLKQI